MPMDSEGLVKTFSKPVLSGAIAVLAFQGMYGGMSGMIPGIEYYTSM